MDDRFEERARGPWRACVRSAWAEPIAAALLDGVHEAPEASAGRGALARFDYPGGAGLIRRYRRGGLAARVLPDAFLADNRPRREFAIHARLEAAGAAVPPLLGVCWRRDAAWYRGAIATGEIPEARTLEDWLRGDPSAPGDTLSRVGAAIRRVHDLGVWHADLQIRNILVAPDGVWLIDFDKARVKRAMSSQARARNLLRLRRSFEKNRLSLEYFRGIGEGYGAARPPIWLDRLYAARGRFSDWLANATRKPGQE